MNFFFEQFPEFIDEDNRSRRGSSPVTIETMSNRLKTIAPENLIKGKTILDLGSCLGAAGQWCLTHGAKHYTGVELQGSYTDLSKKLLGKYWSSKEFEIIQEDLHKFLLRCREENVTYDVILVLGVIYAFVDTFEIVSLISSICSSEIVIESLYPPIMLNDDYPVIHINPVQNINAATTDGAYIGVGAVPSPDALNLLMLTTGFINREGILYPPPAPEGIHDAYLKPVTYERVNYRTEIKKFPSRFIQRYSKTETKTRVVSDVVSAQDQQQIKPFPVKPQQNQSVGNWKFNEEVAARFQTEALQHIPDYNRVIELCIEVADNFISKQSAVLDVGSARGHTLKLFTEAGYENVSGVDNSQSMIDGSYKSEAVTLSEKLPEGSWKMILINWTLHFINERSQYLKDVFNSLENDGILILTDKMAQSPETEILYHKFKSENGVPSEVIEQKKLALEGVLTTRTIEWYLDALKSAGFQGVTVINARLGFVTLMAKKPL